MKQFISTFLLLMLSFYNGIIRAQKSDTNSFKTDSVFSMAGKFKRSKIPLGTDTLAEYKVNNGVRILNAENIRKIEKVNINHVKYYKITTQNIPAKADNITIVTILLDYTDLHLIKMKLTAKTDSGYVEFEQHQFSGWSKLPNEERKTINLLYDGFPLPADASTPWIAGLLSKAENNKFAFPYFALFSNIVKWKIYTILGQEIFTLNEKQYLCWKVDAGPLGPPGYTSYQWYESKTGRFIKSALLKEGAADKYVSELKK